MTISSWGDFLKPASKRQQCLVRVCFFSAHSYKGRIEKGVFYYLLNKDTNVSDDNIGT